MSLFSEIMNRDRARRTRRRKLVNALMLFLTGFLTALALVPLFWIIGYVVIQGGKNINLDFFHKNAPPHGNRRRRGPVRNRRDSRYHDRGSGLCHSARGAGSFLCSPQP